MPVTTPFICIGSRARRCTLAMGGGGGGGGGGRGASRGGGRAATATATTAAGAGGSGGTLDRGRRAPALHTPWHRSKIFPVFTSVLS